jgi:hypothetical protein
MADSYFIKRGEKVKGPFSLAKLQEVHEAQQLKTNDMLSNGAEGPWVAIASVFKEIRQGVAPSLPDPLREDSGATEFNEPSFDGVQPSETKRTLCNDCGKPISKRSTSCPHCGTLVVDDDYGDDDYGDDDYAKRRTHAEQATKFVDRTQKQLDKFGLGFLLSPRQFLDAEIYGFTDSDYPALAAAVRYYAYLAKLVFYILRIFIVAQCGFSCVIGTYATLGSAFSGESAITMVTGSFIALVGFVVFLAIVLLMTAMLLVLNNLGLILSLAGCEMIRVWVRTERNTRTLNN